MRSVLLLPLLALLVVPLHGQEEKRRKGEELIPEVKLDRTTPVTYEKDIEPILINKCAFCHTGAIKEGKFDLTSYDTLMRGGKRGPAILPGKSAESFLFKISKKEVRPFMPPRTETPLSPQELALIKLWIDQGAKPPTGSREAVKIVVKAPPALVTPVLGVAIRPDKAILAAGRGNQIHLYDPSKGTLIKSLQDPAVLGADKKPLGSAHLSLVESLAYSPDGKWLASGSFQEVKLWDAQTGELKRTLSGFSERVVALAFSSNSKLLATGGGAPTQDGELKLFEVESGKLLHDIKNNVHSDTVFSIAFSPDDKLIVSGAADKFVKTFEVASGKFLKAFEGHTHHVMGVGWSGDGKMIASAGADNVVKLWDYEKGEQVRTINASSKHISALLFVPKKNEFLTASGDAQIRMWNTNGGNIRNFNSGNDFLFCLAVSPDGALVAAGAQDGTVKLFNGTNGSLIKSLTPLAEKPAETPKK